MDTCFRDEPVETIKGLISRGLLELAQRGVSVAEVADRMGCSDSLLYKFSNPIDPLRLHVDRLHSWTMATGDFSIMDTIEHSVGRVAFRLPSSSPSLHEVNLATARLVKEFGALLQEVAESLEDGVISPQEAVQVEAKGREVLQHILVVIETVRAKHQPGRGAAAIRVAQ